MANAVYPRYKDALLLGSSDTVLTGSGTSGLYAVLVDTGVYTYNAAHQFYSHLAGIAGSEQEITSITIANGIVDGNDITYPVVASGPSIEALVLFRKNTGANTTWRLVCYMDSGMTGLPATPNGGSIAVTWAAGGIFGL